MPKGAVFPSPAFLAALLLLLQPTEAASSGDGAPRLIVKNGCDTEDIWIANQGFAQLHLSPQMKRLPPGHSISFAIPDEGWESARFWPMVGCNESSGACSVGQSVGGVSGLPECASAGCAPAVDSKFEATFGCRLADPLQCGHTRQGKSLYGPDYFDVSLVDGFTLPYKVEFGGCEPPRRHDGKKVKEFDASRLDYYKMCPRFTDPDEAGGRPLDLMLFSPLSGDVVGCSSPCSRLTIPNWSLPPYNHSTSGDDAKWYCCPAGSLGPGQKTVDACMHGPANRTQYVDNIHEFAPDVYAYAYDDGLGGYNCPSNTTYTITFFCPPSGVSPTRAPTPSPPPPPAPTPSPGPPGCLVCTAGDEQCCNPTLDPPQKCLDGSYCCACGKDSCACPSSL